MKLTTQLWCMLGKEEYNLRGGGCVTVEHNTDSDGDGDLVMITRKGQRFWIRASILKAALAEIERARAAVKE